MGSIGRASGSINAATAHESIAGGSVEVEHLQTSDGKGPPTLS
jgi:hypothetical protein